MWLRDSHVRRDMVPYINKALSQICVMHWWHHKRPQKNKVLWWRGSSTILGFYYKSFNMITMSVKSKRHLKGCKCTKQDILKTLCGLGQFHNAPWYNGNIFDTINGHFLNQPVRDFKIWDSLCLCLENCWDHYSR